MSRRKQAKPQHLRSDQTRLFPELLAISDEEPDDSDSGNESRSGSEEIHVCEKCCAEFFKWSDFCEHMEICTKNPLVIIVKDNESVSATQDTQDYFSESSPIPSCISGLEESGTAGPDGQQTSDETSSSVVEQIALSDQKDGHMEVDLSPKNALLLAESVIRLSQLEEAEQYSDDRNGMPSTNVTLETLQGTRVAVAQFSQSSGTLVSEVSAISISLILDRLMALQHQQIHQLKLIEQILTQVSLIHRQLLSQPDGDEAMKMSLLVTSSSSSGTSVAGPLQLKSFITAPERQIPVKGPSNPIDRDPKSTSTALEPPHSTILQVEEGNHDATNSIPSSIGNPCFTADTCASGETGLDDALGCGVPSTRSPPSPLAPTRGRLLPPSSTLPLLPQTFPSSVIFPNPIASIAETTDALDPISTLMKHCKGKVPTLSALETKPSSEDPFFKHKCRFCAKVFGSDSALQIHLRSHTGERPFKCNICGNRFSTKGNLKVHFQRHKEKYPHIQMNPYPVPEYLDNVPTTTGIPYGMSLLPEKPMTPWLNSKPALSTFSTSTAPLLPSTIHRLMTNYGDSASLSPLHRSPQRQTSPTHGSSPVYPNQASASVGKSSPQSNGKSSSIKTETIYLPANCKSKSLDPCAFPSLVAPLASPNPVPTLPEVPDPVTPASSASEMNVQSESQSKCSFGDLLDSMQTSETTKLQKLVENIDKRMRDPNHCAICHRVLSCQSALKMHYRIHTGERPFKCKICGRAFTTKGNLKTHFGVHRSKPPLRIQHSCPICQKKFTNAVVLQQHIRMHMGGHIPNTPMPEAFQHMDRKFPFDDKCSNKTERFNDDEVEDMEQEMKDEEEVDLLQQQNSPLASAISGIISMTKELQDVGLTISATHSLNTKPCQNGRESEGEIGDMVRVDTPGDLGSSVGQDPQVTGSLAQSGCSSSVEGSPSQDQTKGHHAKSPTQGHYNQKDDLQNAMELNRTVKCEQLNTPPEVDLTATQTTWPLVKEEDAISFLFPGRDRSSHTGPKISSTYSAESNIGRGEINGHSKPALFCEGSHLLSGPIARPQSSGSPSLTPALGPPPPPRRTPKQHNCHLCGKNFSSASALQIHERTHTGEKPFGCSICGRAFTTKGNLKVHMGTHMWNNTPARRGRRLSLENPLPLLGGDAVKFSELLHKERQTPTISIDTAVWSRYAAAVRSGMAARNNEISVIQNRSAPATESDAEGMSGGKKPPCNGLAKTRVELGTGHSFSRLLEQSNRIGID